MPGPVDARLLRQARATAPHLAACVLLGVLGAACVLAQAALLAHAIAALTVPFSLLAVVAARAVLAWGREVAAHRAAADVTSQLRARLLERLTTGRPAQACSGELTALVTRGVDALDPYFSGYLPQLALAVIVPVAIVGALAQADLLSAVIVLVTLPLIPLFGALIGMCAAARTRRQWRTLELLAGHFADVVAGLPTLKAFGRADAQARQIARVAGEHRRATGATLKLAFCSALVLEIAATLSVALVAVSVGLRLVSGSLPFETALFVLILAPEAYLPLRQAAAQFHAGQEGVAAADRILSVLTPPPASGDPSVDPSLRPPPQPPRKGRPSASGRIQADEIVVAHPGREPVGPYSLTLEPGTLTALTGTSGIGKSTLIAVLLGFTRPATGRVLAGGEALDAGADADWRRQIAWVPQRPFFFAGTIADNIALAVPDAPGDAVRRAAAATGVLDITALDARLAPGGAGLSAGERQRVALARAALRCDLLGTPLLILDEPTAHLDVLTEIETTEILLRLARGRTALIVTHRRTLLDRADQVVALEPAALTGPPVRV
ncbi:thiol reductant ABC exporter subunit CydD [Actinomadura xylanilytica]|uniref:thiol reductant ABC exporter subunit CydD n=1 Tax=Actinomadura xylanilytica TaxID=887459 RepID=UPI00255B0A00|nr:thiol reductant ABC exporter subunit CydD [Actinomadura xylanilytica]MDL4771993.1 thiol reductant ABC exporter subunit CydD [Actinomadura xylanilytica]